MELPTILGKEKELFTYMKHEGYPVFHMSNIFLRDIQYGIRDYYRSTYRKDIGTRKSDAMAKDFIADLESKGVLLRSNINTWILQMPEFLNPPKAEEKKEATT
jgi:hypothetical protein